MRYLLPSLLLCACQLPAEEAQIQYGGQAVTVTLPAPVQAAGGVRAIGGGDGDSRLRLVNTTTAIDIHDALLICVQPDVDVPALALRHHLSASQGPLPQIWRLTAPGDVRAAIAASTALRAAPGVLWVEQEVSAPAHLKVDLTPQQWHLVNDGTVAGTAGNDLNVAGAWAAGVSGLGVNIAIIDSGIDLSHPDLLANLKTALDTDIVGNDADPSAEGVFSAALGEDIEAHGTVVASVAAARGDNNFGVTGVAYRSGIIGVRLITGVAISSSQKATALGWLATNASLTAGNRSDVLNNSWGPGDDAVDHGSLTDEPSSVEQTTLAAGVTSGRGGKGAIYIFASGNGRRNSDSADFDGYASNRLVMAFGASNGIGEVSSYSEGGLCLFANAPVGESSGIVAADRQGLNKGFNLAASPTGDYTTNAEDVVGTSFSAPQAAGVVALLLEKNPNLTWRDVRHLIARTAVKIQPSSATWRTLPPSPGSSTPLHWSPDFGFGRIDASAAVALADPATWALIPGESAPLTALKSIQQAIPDGASTGVGGDLVIAANAQFRVESVEFAMTVAHANQSQLSYTLISPAGTRATIVGRPNDVTAARTRVFTSLAQWGEGANGTWRVEVADRVGGTVGTLGAVAISVYGYIAGSAAVNNPVSGGGSTGGLVGNNDPSVTPPTGGGSTNGGNSSADDGGGGLCGLGSGSVAMLLSGFLVVLMRRNLRA